MSTPLNQQIERIEQSRNEGIVYGVITTLQSQGRSINLEQLTNKVLQSMEWSEEKINYWLNEFSLE